MKVYVVTFVTEINMMKTTIPIPCTGDFARSQPKSADPLPNLGIVTLSQHWEGASLLPSAATVPSETPQSHEGIYNIIYILYQSHA